MSTALRKQEYATIETFTVTAGETATLGYLAIFGATDLTVQDAAGDTDLGIGIFLRTATAGNRVEVLLFNHVVAVVVGTGGATRGTKATFVADGFTDAAAHDSSGTTDDNIYGIFMQSGVAGDRVGMMMFPSNRGSA